MVNGRSFSVLLAASLPVHDVFRLSSHAMTVRVCGCVFMCLDVSWQDKSKTHVIRFTAYNFRFRCR